MIIIVIIIIVIIIRLTDTPGARRGGTRGALDRRRLARRTTITDCHPDLCNVGLSHLRLRCICHTAGRHPPRRRAFTGSGHRIPDYRTCHQHLHPGRTGKPAWKARGAGLRGNDRALRDLCGHPGGPGVCRTQHAQPGGTYGRRTIHAAEPVPSRPVAALWCLGGAKGCAPFCRGDPRRTGMEPRPRS